MPSTSFGPSGTQPTGAFRTGRRAASCDWCLNDFPADAVDVDHVRPLSMGGTNTDGNVQTLCRGCHQLKTGTEFGMVHK
ncbi:HNH endonuclease [Streptomyces sp. NPDC048330]|uniref:HNH endonuclease n=1 Tax=Streptomyces sp. NPDC048330 TaxID=3365533 RepID=UPI00371FBDFB